MRMIDAEKYMELLKEQYLHNKFMNYGEAAKAWQGAMQLLYDMPTLTPPNESMTLERGLVQTVAPVRHGYWYDCGSLSCRCSKCGCKNNRETAYCPNCGARMDKENEGEY